MAFIPDKAVDRMRDIPPPAFQLYTYICKKRNHQSGGYLLPLGLMASETGMDKAQICRLLGTLAQQNWIAREGEFISPIMGDFSVVKNGFQNGHQPLTERQCSLTERQWPIDGASIRTADPLTERQRSIDGASMTYKEDQILPEHVQQPDQKQKHMSNAEEPRPTARSVLVKEIFDYWKQAMNHPKAILIAKRERAVERRLKEGYTVEQIKMAIDGCRASPWHQGENDRQTAFNDLELICRDGGKLENFIGLVNGRGNENGRRKDSERRETLGERNLRETIELLAPK